MVKIPPRIIGLLSWYEESPAFLAATIASIAPYIDHLVAVDGAYALYPDARPRSGPEQAATIREVAYGAGIGLTIHAPDDVWAGNEVEKRTFMFRLAELVSEPTDWYWIIDGDEIVTSAPHNLRERLAQTTEDAASICLWERDDAHETPEKSLVAQRHDAPNVYRSGTRRLYRALRGMYVTGAHYVYAAPCSCNGSGCPICLPVCAAGDVAGVPGIRHLWGNVSLHRLQPLADFMDEITMEHRNRYRDVRRRKDAHRYYGLRNEAAIEHL